MIIVVSAIIAALAGLIGVAFGARLTERQQQAQRRADFLEHQLRDFYSPLISLLDQILAKTRLRQKILKVASEDPRVKGDQFTRLIQHDNEHFVEEIFPDYQKMLAIFRDNFWLAETETRSHFSALFEFVEIWNRWLKGTLSSELVPIIGHSEELLHPFYDQLRRKHDELQTRLSQGKA